MISTTPAFSSFSLSWDVTRLYRPPAAALCMCVFAHARMLFQSRGANILPAEDMSEDGEEGSGRGRILLAIESKQKNLNCVVGRSHQELDQRIH